MLERITALRGSFSAWQCDALLVDHPIDLFYLTGLRMSAGRLFITRGAAQLFVDGRYFEIAKSKVPSSVEVARLEEDSQKRFLAQAGIRKLAFDSATMSYDRYEKCNLSFGEGERVLVAIPSPLKNFRAIKTEEELVKMRKSAALTKEGLRHLCTILTPGVKEKDLAWEFEKFCRERGAEKMAFEPIIAFGSNTSFPHHRASDRPLLAGDPVMIDVGCVLNDYASDVTRTLWSAKVPPEFFRLQKIVVRAQKAALSICLPGTSFGDLDAAAREVMREEGVEELFAHSLGHGIGLETHEFPRISLRAEERDTRLKEGMVITIEPGLYAPGICGARHEDTVIVWEKGPENLYEDLTFINPQGKYDK